MLGIDISQTVQAWMAIAIVVGMLVLFIREIFPVEVTALAGAAADAGAGYLAAR